MRTFLVALFIICAISIHAQTQTENLNSEQAVVKSSNAIEYAGAFDGGYFFGKGKNGNGRIALDFVNGIQFNSHIAIGVGIGFRKYIEATETVIPLYFQFRSTFLDSKTSPYISLGAGYSYNASDRFIGVGYLFHPSVGISIRGANKSAMIFSVGYEFQENNRNYFGSSGRVFKASPRRADLGAISVKFGTTF